MAVLVRHPPHVRSLQAQIDGRLRINVDGRRFEFYIESCTFEYDRARVTLIGYPERKKTK